MAGLLTWSFSSNKDGKMSAEVLGLFERFGLMMLILASGFLTAPVIFSMRDSLVLVSILVCFAFLRSLLFSLLTTLMNMNDLRMLKIDVLKVRLMDVKNTTAKIVPAPSLLTSRAPLIK